MTKPDFQKDELAEVYEMLAKAVSDNYERLIQEARDVRKPSQGTPANER